MNSENQELAFDQLDKASGGVYRPPHFTRPDAPIYTHVGRAQFNRQVNAAVKSLVSSIGNIHF
jgi:hypothetical protein